MKEIEGFRLASVLLISTHEIGSRRSSEGICCIWSLHQPRKRWATGGSMPALSCSNSSSVRVRSTVAALSFVEGIPPQ